MNWKQIWEKDPVFRRAVFVAIVFVSALWLRWMSNLPFLACILCTFVLSYIGALVYELFDQKSPE